MLSRTAKGLIIGSAMAALLVLSACGNKQTDVPSASAGDLQPAITSDWDMNEAVTKNGETVFRMPISYFFDDDGEMLDLVQFAEDNDLTAAEYDKESDSVRITMPEQGYQDLLKDLRKQITDTLDVMWQDKDYTPFMEGITPDTNFEVVDVLVNDEYDRDSALYDVAPQIAIFAQMYQDYLGWNGTKDTVVQFKDADGNILDALTFPEAWEFVEAYEPPVEPEGELPVEGEVPVSDEGAIAEPVDAEPVPAEEEAPVADDPTEDIPTAPTKGG